MDLFNAACPSVYSIKTNLMKRVTEERGSCLIIHPETACLSCDHLVINNQNSFELPFCLVPLHSSALFYSITPLPPSLQTCLWIRTPISIRVIRGHTIKYTPTSDEIQSMCSMFRVVCECSSPASPVQVGVCPSLQLLSDHVCHFHLLDHLRIHFHSASSFFTRCCPFFSPLPLVSHGIDGIDRTTRMP